MIPNYPIFLILEISLNCQIWQYFLNYFIGKLKLAVIVKKRKVIQGDYILIHDALAIVQKTLMSLTLPYFSFCVAVEVF